MKNLFIAWGVVLAVIAGAGSYLWFTDISEAEATPIEESAGAVAQEPGVLSSGPIVVEMNKATEAEEDCLGSC